jgi:hypothetical protein
MSQRVNLTQKILTIDSSERTSGTGSSFDVNIDMPRFNAFNKASVVICEVPKAWYASDTAMTGLIDGTDTYTMATGEFWTAATFATALATAMNAASAKTFTTAYSSVTGKITITGSAAFTHITSDALLAKYLGIEVGVTQDSADFTGDITTSTKLVNMQRYDSIHVNCSIISNNNSPRLLTMFPSQTPDLSMIGYTSPAMDLGSVNLTNNGSTSVHIDVVDSSGSVIDLNGMNVRLVLSCYNESD